MTRYVEWLASSSVFDDSPLMFGPMRELRAVSRRAVENEAGAAQVSRQQRADRWTVAAWLDGDPVVRVDGELDVSVSADGRRRSRRSTAWTLRWHDHPDHGWVVIDTHSQHDSKWQSETACSHPGAGWTEPRGWWIRPLWSRQVADRGWVLLASLSNTSESPMRFLDINGRWRSLGSGLEAVLISRPRLDPNADVVFELAPHGRLARKAKATVSVTLPPGHPRLGWCGTGL